MTKAEQFEALALLCEQVTGADEDLDWSIGLVIKLLDFRWNDRRDLTEVFDNNGKYLGTSEDYQFNVPCFTASLDAALTLVPDGSPASLIIFANKRSFAECEDDNQREAATPALALCAAALRARAQMERGSDV